MAEAKINPHSNAEEQYLQIMSNILTYGSEKDDRTGTGTLSLFSANIIHDFRNGFPLITTKKVHWKSVVHELLWFLSGDTNTKYLKDNGVRIWDEWSDEQGNLGKIYGHQYRNFNGVDQLQELINGIKNNPDSRRHVLTLWNPADLPNMALPPCHGISMVFYVDKEYISLATTQRSSDWFLGVPFNIASYGLLLKMVAEVTGYKPAFLDYKFVNIHIYKDHIEQCFQQLDNYTNGIYDPPTVEIVGGPFENITDIKYENILLKNYESWPAIKAKVSV